MVNYDSVVKHSICNRKISPKTTKKKKKMAFGSVTAPKKLRFLHENPFCNRIRQKNCTDLTEKILFTSV